MAEELEVKKIKSFQGKYGAYVGNSLVLYDTESELLEKMAIVQENVDNPKVPKQASASEVDSDLVGKVYDKEKKEFKEKEKAKL